MAEDKVPMILCRIYLHAWETEMSYGQLYLSFLVNYAQQFIFKILCRFQ